jgi:adenylate kinase
VIIILGVAGSGKSTQSQLLAAKDGFDWLSMGELLRSVITDERREQMLAGKVLDEHEVISILDAELTRRGDNPEVILDGFPRGLMQADWLIAQRASGRFAIRAVVHLHAHQSAVKERLLARGRQDDTEDAIKERFYEYEHTIKPIIETLHASGIPIVEVNAEQIPESVFVELEQGMAQIGIQL